MNLSIRAARPEDAFRLVPLIHAFAGDVAEAARPGPGAWLAMRSAPIAS
jgi:hypothetical protein